MDSINFVSSSKETKDLNNETNQDVYTNIFEDGSLKEYIGQNLVDPWKDTYFEGYVYMSPKQKGEFGERLVSMYMEKIKKCKVLKPESYTGPFDRIIDDLKVEIKFSLACRSCRGIEKDRFIINHVSESKDWNRLIFCGINEREQDMRIGFITKEDFTLMIGSETSPFKYQQGGKKIKNDDYICSGPNMKKFLEMEQFKSLDKW